MVEVGPDDTACENASGSYDDKPPGEELAEEKDVMGGEGRGSEEDSGGRAEEELKSAADEVAPIPFLKERVGGAEDDRGDPKMIEKDRESGHFLLDSWKGGGEGILCEPGDQPNDGSAQESG